MDHFAAVLPKGRGRPREGRESALLRAQARELEDHPFTVSAAGSDQAIKFKVICSSAEFSGTREGVSHSAQGEILYSDEGDCWHAAIIAGQPSFRRRECICSDACLPLVLEALTLRMAREVVGGPADERLEMMRPFLRLPLSPSMEHVRMALDARSGSAQPVA
jgi:hypothetical protein